ncbi:4-(cytidine 5'-diphospho)-2-C-methyl-D-erythritol kinase [Pantanalinema rosaneae CENA516]|uniref:4-(cytidine 5'-diphospho)-2-C-methyl-D-erythritol kinase n=1 Tax=Pantanalinema rosaneae TaxID=1620701 RepID=UPI003D6E975C
MRSYTLLAPAKINLYLEILGDRPDGFHELVMVLQSVTLADEIELRANGTDLIRVHCDHPLVPGDRSNLAYRAAELMGQRFPDAFARYGAVDITIRKQIPVGAGLAGGSTNAAAVLVGIDLMWQLGLTLSELQELGAQLGSDVPFCIAGGTALATGRGEKLDPLPDLDQIYLVLAKYRSLAVSTVWAYKTYRQQFGSSYLCAPDDLECRRQKIHSGAIVSAIAQRNGSQIGQHLYNDLEKVVLPAHPQVLQLRETFQQLGTLGTMMSGSGPTVFALAESPDQAHQIHQQVRERIADPDLEIWVAKFNPTGIQVVK